MSEDHIMDRIWIRDRKTWAVGIIKPGGIPIIAPRENLLRQLFMDTYMESEDTFAQHMAKAITIFKELYEENRKLDYIR